MQQIKSKKRVSEHGEVFTNKKEVNAMINLLPEESMRIESKVLEQACGEGAFLEEILERKFKLLLKKYRRSEYDIQRFTILAISSLYGIDIQEDNVIKCREKLSKISKNFYIKNVNEWRQEVIDSIDFILSKNIVCGDSLTMKDKHNKPIVFSEWSLVDGWMIKRREYKFDSLFNYGSLYNVDSPTEIAKIIPIPIQEFPLQNLLRIKNE